MPTAHIEVCKPVTVTKYQFPVAVVNSDAVNIAGCSGVLISFGIMVFSRYMPRSGIAGSYGRSPGNFSGLPGEISITSDMQMTPPFSRK